MKSQTNTGSYTCYRDKNDGLTAPWIPKEGDEITIEPLFGAATVKRVYHTVADNFIEVELHDTVFTNGVLVNYRLSVE